MEFEDMQVIWNSQDEEKLYAINEAALFEQIKHKGRSVDRKLAFVEIMMVAVNLGVGIMLVFDAVRDNEQAYQYVLPVMYLAYAVFAVVRRLRRRQDEVHFAPTMLGELDKAIWRVDYLIRQGRTLVLWYLLPLVLVAAATMALNAKPFWALGLLLFLIPFGYFGGRWEVDKFYVPQKRSLTALRDTLVASEPPEE